MLTDDGKTIELKLAKQMPSWFKWAGYAVFCGLTLGYSGTNLVVPYIVSFLGLVSWYIACKAYQTAANLYNEREIGRLIDDGTLSELMGLTDNEEDDSE